MKHRTIRARLLVGVGVLAFGVAPSAVADDASAPPEPSDDSYTTNEDVPLTLTPLDNDLDLDGDPLTIQVTSAPSNGRLVGNEIDVDFDGFVDGIGSLDYTPRPNWSGVDSFTYSAFDGIFTSYPATVTITVEAVNDVPVAKPDKYLVSVVETVIGPPGVLDNDKDREGDPLEAVLISGTSHGAGPLVLNPDGSFAYTPAPGFLGRDQFTYAVSDGVDTSAETTVDLKVETPPVEAGYDLIRTTKALDDFNSRILPGDLFGPGCEDFSGLIEFEGVPLGTLFLGRDTIEAGDADTVVQRLDDVEIPNVGDTATIPIQITALQLQSTHPITVAGCPGTGEFQVNLTLGPGVQPEGSMTITRDQENGGTFNTDALFVQPLLTFTRIDAPWEVPIVIDPCLILPEDECVQVFTSTNGTWKFDPTLPYPLGNFAVGHCADPVCILCPPERLIFCEGDPCPTPRCLTKEEALYAEHDVLPSDCVEADPPSDLDLDGVCDEADPCPLDNPDDLDEDGVCNSDDVCDIGDDTIDTDGDGIPDACDDTP